MYGLLVSEKASDHAERDAPVRAGQRAHGQAAVKRSALLLGGSLATTTDGAAVLLFQRDTRRT